MTVAQLIAALQQFPPDVEVFCIDDGGYLPPEPWLESSQERRRADGSKFVYPAKDRVIL